MEATPEQLFALLSTPSRHGEMDSSSWLRGSDDAALTAVGDSFVINMNNDLLGDYQTRNTVVAFERHRAIGWAPPLHPDGGYQDKIGDMRPGGQTYTWHLERAGSGTEVTQVYDWRGIGDPASKGALPDAHRGAAGRVDRAGGTRRGLTRWGARAARRAEPRGAGRAASRSPLVTLDPC